MGLGTWLLQPSFIMVLIATRQQLLVVGGSIAIRQQLLVVVRPHVLALGKHPNAFSSIVDESLNLDQLDS